MSAQLEPADLKNTKALERTESATAALGTSKLNASELAALMQTGAASAQIVKLQEPTREGVDTLRGRYIGRGSSVSYIDPSGDHIEIATHVFDLGTHRVQLMTSHQLEMELGFYIDRDITVVRGQTSDTKNDRKVNKFLILDHEDDRDAWNRELVTLQPKLRDEYRVLKTKEERCDAIAKAVRAMRASKAATKKQK